MFLRSFWKSLAVVTFVSALVPVAAFADEAKTADKTHQKGERKDKPSFPMTGTEFKARSEKHLGKVRERVQKHLEKKGISKEQREATMKKLDGDVAQIRGAVDTAVKDGTVTKDEAKSVHEIAKQMKKDFPGKHGKGKDGKGKDGKGKGKGKGKNKSANDA